MLLSSKFFDFELSLGRVCTYSDLQITMKNVLVLKSFGTLLLSRKRNIRFPVAFINVLFKKKKERNFLLVMMRMISLRIRSLINTTGLFICPTPTYFCERVKLSEFSSPIFLPCRPRYRKVIFQMI